MKQSIWWLVSGLLLLFSCNKPTELGSDLLDQDQIPNFFADTFSIVANTVTTDSLRTYDPGLGAQSGYLLGTFVDPVFGKSKAKVTFQVRLDFETPDFTDAILDSMVLALPFQGFRGYGDLTEPFDLELYTLAEEIDETMEIYSNRVFATDQLVHSGSLYFTPEDSLNILEYGETDGSTILVPPQARLRLDQAFAESLLNEPADVFNNDTSFLKVLPGFQLTAVSENPGMMSLDLRSGARAEMIAYYRIDSTFEEYTFPINIFSVKVSTFEHDYTGSIVEPFINDPEKGDSLLFAQGMAGVSTTFEFPTIESLSGKIVNRAELLLPIIFLDEDDEAIYPPTSQLIVSQRNENGELEVIEDIIFAITRENLQGLFGGFPEDEDPMVYRLNLSSHIQDMKEGIVGDKIQITIFTRFEKASRVVVCGPQHPDNPSKLRIYYSEL